MKRKWLAICALVAIASGALWLSLDDDPSSSPEPGAVTSDAPAPRVEPRWTQPITTTKGAKRLEGVVRRSGQPVSGAIVTALAHHGEDVLSDLPCQCDNHCGRKLLECGCAEAAAQLVDLVAARTGEAMPVARATSGQDGRFVLEGLDDTELALWADAASGVAWKGGLHAGDDAVLELAEGHSIEGVVKAGDGKPLAGALVTAIYAEHSRFFDTQTDARGHFKLERLLEGKYAVVATHGALLPDHSQVETSQAKPLSLTLDVPRALSGTVIAEGGQPFAGAKVRLEGMHRIRTVTTDAAGAFAFSQLRPGEYDLEATAPSARGRASVEVAKRSDKTGVTISLAQGVGLSGMVKDEAGALLPGATVFVSEGDDWRKTTTDAAGRFTVESLEPGTHWVSARMQGHLDAQSTAVKVLAETRDVTLVLAKAAPLSGRVVDVTGRLVSSFEVTATHVFDAGSLEDEGADAVWRRVKDASASQSSRDGGFAFDVIPGALTLTVSAPPFATTSIQVHAPATDVVVTLKQGAVIKGLVLDAEGAPLAGVGVSISRRESWWQQLTAQSSGWVETGADGRFELAGLAAGTVTLSSHSADKGWEANGGLPEQQVSLREGETVTVVIRARRGATIDGVVTAHGAPVAGALVHLFPVEKSAPWRIDNVTTNDEGRFRFTGLTPGAFSVTAMIIGDRDGFADQAVTAPASGVVLKLGGDTEISGRVVGDDGKPLPEFKVNGKRFDAADGRFIVSAEPGETQLGFDSDGYAQYIVRVDVKTGANELGDVRMSKGRLVEGRVFDLQTREPIEGALVDVGVLPSSGEVSANFSLDDKLGAARTDVNGKFRLRVDSRSNVIFASAAGYVPFSRALPLASLLELGLALGGSLEVTVLSAGGKPITAGVSVMATGPRGRVVSLGRVPSGQWWANALDVGQWVLRANARGVVFRPKSVQVIGGETQKLTLTEATDGVEVTVEGEADRLLLVSGSLPRAHLKLDALTDREQLAASDGRFRAVLAGEWSLIATREVDDHVEYVVVPVQVQTNAVQVRLPATGWMRFTSGE